MKIISMLNNLIEKTAHYIEFNALLFFSTLFILFCLFNFIIVKFFDAPYLLIWDIYIIFLFKYVIVCAILLGIFLFNALTFKIHINYNKKIPLWYKILFLILLIANIIWIICISPHCYSIVHDAILGIH